MSLVRRQAVRFGVQTALLLLALLALVGGVAFVLYEHAEHADAESTLRSVAEGSDPDRLDNGFWMVVQRAGRRTATPDLPAVLPVEPDLAAVAADGRPRQQEVEGGGSTYFVRTEQHGDRTVQVAMDRTEAEGNARRVILALLLACAVGAVAAGVVAVGLARRAMRPAADALALQRRFISDASHELRTPLTLLSTRVQVLARKLERGVDARAEIEGVLADTVALTGVLEELLVSAEAGSTADRAPFDLSGVVRACVQAAQAAAEGRGVMLRVLAASPATVTGSEPALRRAVTSLLDNAVDHARTEVVVELRPGRSEVEIVVADDGPGVPLELRDRLFERFASVRPVADGTGSEEPVPRRHYGLGLALVAEVVEAHGGHVAVGGRADGRQGSAFTVTIPRSAAERSPR